MYPTWCMALVAGEELFQFVAVFILTVRVSDIRDRGQERTKHGHGPRTRSRAKEGGDVTSLDGGRRDERGGVFIHILTLQEVKNEN